MPRFAKPKGKAGPPPTFLCRNRVEITRALAAIRDHMGISQLELDNIAGFADGYTGKLECLGAPAAPRKRTAGRSALHGSFDTWLSSLGLGLVVVALDRDQMAIVPRRPGIAPPPMTYKRAQKMRRLHTESGASVNTLYRLFQCSPVLARNILDGKAFSRPTKQQ